MPEYRVFGRTLTSDLPFPELRDGTSGDGPAWRVRREASAPGPAGGDLVGETSIDDGVAVRLFRSPDGFRLEYADTGTFDVSKDQVVWHPAEGAATPAARADILGRALPAALHLNGHLCLHASAVAAADGAIAFLGPKRFGKSTLAAALVGRGAGLITDDALAVTAPPDPMALPGVPSVRLWEDSARSVRVPSRRRRGLGGKFLLAGLPADRLLDAPLPLRALYVLEPVRPAAGRTVDREELPALRAAVSMVANAKNGDLLGGPEAQTLLGRAAALAAAVPVYRLRVHRDLERLPEAADRILGWHERPDRSPEWRDSDADRIQGWRDADAGHPSWREVA